MDEIKIEKVEKFKKRYRKSEKLSAFINEIVDYVPTEEQFEKILNGEEKIYFGEGSIKVELDGNSFDIRYCDLDEEQKKRGKRPKIKEVFEENLGEIVEDSDLDEILIGKFERGDYKIIGNIENSHKSEKGKPVLDIKRKINEINKTNDEYDDQYEEDEYEYDEEEWDPYKEMEDLARYEDEKRQEFIWSLMKDNVVEFHLTKDPADLINFVDTKISRMIGFDQKNSHHCYDLWEHTLRTVEGIKPDGLTEEQFEKLRVAAFFHDIGKLDVAKFNEQTGQQVFYGHATQSADVARPMLEVLGYNQEEINQIVFYIGHHDDFISYKSKLEPFMINHEFIRGISPESVAEKMIENKFDFEKMGYNKDQIRVICYTLANGKKPEFQTKDGPIEIPVDMEEVKEKINSQKYNMPYDASVEDYKMLLKLCKADAGAQSEIAMQNGRQVGSKAEKLENMDNIESVVAQAYRNVTQIVNEMSHLKEDRDIAEHDMKMEDLGTSLPIMENEDIAKKYEELLSERIEMLKAEEDGEKRDKKAWELNSHLIELVEIFAESSPELQERLMEEKQIASREYYGDDKEEVVEFEDDDPEYIDALLEREIRTKEARDAGFEINEYGEIIRSAKQPTTEELEKMSEEELQEMIEKNNRIIESNKTLKKSLVERILNQQKIISEQQQEIMELNSQKKEL